MEWREDGVETLQMSAPGSRESRQDPKFTWKNWLRNVKCVFSTQQAKHNTQHNVLKSITSFSKRYLLCRRVRKCISNSAHDVVSL